MFGDFQSLKPNPDEHRIQPIEASQLANARFPVLVMAGDQDPVCPLADALDIVAALPPPWGRLVRFANSGHGAWRDEPEAAFALLREFITTA